MWNLILKNAVSEPVYKNRLSDFSNKLMLTEEKSGGRSDKLGLWDSDTWAPIYKIDNQQGPTVEHREFNIL